MVATSLKSIAIALILFLVFVQKTFAEMMEKGKGRVKTVLNLYNQDSDSGKQVFNNSGNEDVTVVEPMIFVKHQIDETTEVSGQFVYDLWSAESDTIIDGQTGASGKGKKKQPRSAPSLGVRKESGKKSYGANVGYSSEYDYLSKNISFNYTELFAEDNFTLGGSFQYYADTVDLFSDLSNPPEAKITKGHHRDIMAINLGASQILTRHDLVGIGVTVASSKGRLESTAGTINVEGEREVERLPSKRLRKAATLNWSHAFTEEIAIAPSYRYYLDDWGASANTIKTSLLFSLRDDLDLLELSARYHDQKKVDYYRDSFSTREKFMTSDSDMSEFQSTEVSIYYLRSLDDSSKWGFDFTNLEWGSGVTYAKRDTGLTYGYIQTSFAITY